MEDDKRGDGDAADDPGLQEGADQVHHHHLSQAWSSVGGSRYCLGVNVQYNNGDLWPARRRSPVAVYYLSCTRIDRPTTFAHQPTSNKFSTTGRDISSSRLPFHVSLPRLPSPLVPPQVPLCRCYPLICALDVPMAVPRRRKSPPVYGPRAGTCPARQSSVRARIGRLGTGEPLPPRRAQSPPRHRLCEALRFRLLAQHV